MKQYLFTLSLLISVVINAQSHKKMAVMEPICRDNSVESFYKTVIRGATESVVSATDEYEAYDRSAFDQIVKEHNFQRSGAVSDSDIKRMGELAGVDYILVSELTAAEGYMSVIVKVLNVETGKYEGAKDGLMLMNDIPDIRNKTKQLVSLLFGVVDIESGLRRGELQLEEGKYVGEILNGQPNGKGKLYYDATDSKERTYYEGDWKNGKRCGYGTLEWKDGSKYVGDWDRDENWTGKGKYYLANGDRYEGDFANNAITGYGIYYMSDGRRYEGYFKDGNYNGKGKFFWPNGDKYEGDFVNTTITGYGTANFVDGRKYVGQWKDGKFHGKGKLYFASSDENISCHWTHCLFFKQGLIFD